MKRIVPIACLLLLAAACSDDPAQSTPTPDMSTDMPSDTNNSTADMEIPEDMAIDMVEPDMPADMTSDVPEPDMEADMEVDMEEDMPTPIPFTWPTSPNIFAATADANSYIRELNFPPVMNNTTTCCKDFGAISKNAGIDNALATLNNSLSGFGADMQGPLTDAIQSGDAVILLDHRELDGATDADGFILSWLSGAFANGTTYGTASFGNGQFRVQPDAFVPGTGEPLIKLNPASMNNSQMNAGPSGLNFSLPFLGSTLVVAIEAAEVTGTATISNNGVEYTQGTLAGYITLDSLYGAMNTILTANCGCLGANPAVFSKNSSGVWGATCVSGANNLCPADSEQICRILAGNSLANGQYCSLLPNILNNQADIDANNDDAFEALSMGFEWTAANADIVP